MDSKFKDKKVLIFGLGLNQGGVGSAQFFAKQGANVKVTDLKSKDILESSLKQLAEFKDISYTLGGHKYEDIIWADLIIKNPAVKPENPYIKYGQKHNKTIETDMGIFLRYIRPDQIIGVTGTKGKSTTTSLIYEALKSSGKNIVLAGNIGKSVLELIPIIQKSLFPPRGWKARAKELLVTLELSSFQLEAFKQHKISPKWAVITNITPDHLNYHTDMEEYVATKKNIAKYQTKNDFLFIRKGDQLVDQPAFLVGFKANIIRFSKNDLPKNFNSKLLGEHNLENIAATLSLARNFGIDQKSALNTLSEFKGIPFRMELIKEWNGIKIYNDTTATSPEASIKAIKTLGANLNSPVECLILICGGMNKKMNYTKYAKAIEKFVKRVFFLEGNSTNEIIKKIQSSKFKVQNCGIYNNLEKLLREVKKIAKPGDTIIFSPAATSFNLFQNEFDRGRKFNEAVRKVFEDA